MSDSTDKANTEEETDPCNPRWRPVIIRGAATVRSQEEEEYKNWARCFWLIDYGENAVSMAQDSQCGQVSRNTAKGCNAPHSGHLNIHVSLLKTGHCFSALIISLCFTLLFHCTMMLSSSHISLHHPSTKHFCPNPAILNCNSTEAWVNFGRQNPQFHYLTGIESQWYFQ